MVSQRAPDDIIKNFQSGSPDTGVFLVTGQRGTGKTTWLLNLIQTARAASFEIVGLISPGVFENNEKQAILLIDLASGEERIMSTRADPHLHAGPGGLLVHENEGLVLGGWLLNEKTIQWGNELLQYLLQPVPKTDAKPLSIFILDELGPLEFIHSKGLLAALQFSQTLNSPTDSPFRTSFIVVRPGLLSYAQQHWPGAQILEIPDWRQ